MDDLVLFFPSLPEGPSVDARHSSIPPSFLTAHLMRVFYTATAFARRALYILLMDNINRISLSLWDPLYYRLYMCLVDSHFAGDGRILISSYYGLILYFYD